MSDIPECSAVDDCSHIEMYGIAPNTLPPGVNRGRRQVNAMLLMGLLALHPSVRAQRSAPPYQVTDFDWVDHARSRPVPARLYWPTGSASDLRAIGGVSPRHRRFPAATATLVSTGLPVVSPVCMSSMSGVMCNL